MADEKIRLGLDLGDSSQKAKELASSLGDVGESAQDAAQSFEVLASAGSQKLVASKQAVADASDRAAKATKGWGTEMLTAGRIAQDFAQGGVGGILNNIEGLLVKFPALAGAATAVGVALYVGIPIVKEWWKQWQEGSNAIPDITEGLDKLSAALKTNKEWIDKVSEKGYLTDDEVTEFKARVAEMAQGEKDLAEAKKARAAAEQLAAVQTTESAEAAAEASRVLKESLAGETDDVISSVEGRLIAKSQELKAAAKQFDEVYKQYNDALDGVTDVAQINAINQGYTKKLAELTKLQGEIKQRIASDAANLVGDAVLKGSEESIRKIAGLGGEFADAFKAAGRAGRAARIKEAEDDAAELVRVIEESDRKIAEKYGDAVDRWVEGFADKFSAVNDMLRKQIEDADAAASSDKNAQGSQIIRDVENQDFFRSGVDKNGRAFEQNGLGLTSKQVDDAANAAREFQRSAREQGGGLTDREAAQLAIQEQVVKNQQQMSDNWNATNERMNRVLREARTVPSLLQFGMGQ